VRVDGTEQFLRQKCGELSSWIDVQVCHGIYHAGTSKENPHVHIIIQLLAVLQKQSFDIRIKKLFDVKERNDYSTKAWDGNYGEGAGSYMYHESDDSPVLCSKGLTELHIQQFKEANKSVQRVMALNNEKANNKLVDCALAEFSNHSWSASDEFKFDIYWFMFKRCKEGLNYWPNEFQFKKYVEEVHVKLCPSQNLEGFARQKFNSMFRI